MQLDYEDHRLGIQTNARVTFPPGDPLRRIFSAADVATVRVDFADGAYTIYSRPRSY